MTGLSNEMTALTATVTNAVQRQLDGLSGGFETSTATVANLWTQALEEHRHAGNALAEQLRVALERFTRPSSNVRRRCSTACRHVWTPAWAPSRRHGTRH